MRESGYYWVKHGLWEIGRFQESGECWFLSGSDKVFKDADFERIGNIKLKLPSNYVKVDKQKATLIERMAKADSVLGSVLLGNQLSYLEKIKL